MQPQIGKELAGAIEASQRAAEVVMSYYKQNLVVEQKVDASPVTVADREAERVIRSILQEQFPTYGFIGEEFGTSSAAASAQWVIDPIDGTKNFIKGIPFFGILIGLVRSGEFELGVSNVPGMQELLYAQRGLGAFLNHEAVRVSSETELSESMVSVGGMKHFVTSGMEAGLARVIEKVSRSRAFGDAYAYHLVASGRFEAVIEAKVDIWDIAAPVAIIEAAGGMCTDINGNPITDQTHTIIASNGKVHEEIVRLFKS